MAKPKKTRWKGEAVEPTPDAEAEHGADLAEGRGPGHAPDAETLAEQPTERIARAPSGEEPDEKIEETAEAHRERAASPDRPARGRL